MSARPRVLLIAEACNPATESVPLEAFNLFQALRRIADVHLVTHIRNRAPLANRLGDLSGITFIDNEMLAAPCFRLAHWLSFGRGVGWTIKQAAMWLPYLYFERLVYRRFHRELAAGRFDLVHRFTPLTPTYGSPLASWTRVPFVMGPINGGLPWPSGTTVRRLAELEFLSYVRHLYRWLPYCASTYRRAACVIAGSRFTQSELPAGTRSVYIPENGIDPARFSPGDRLPPARVDPFRILFVGRLVPYKCADVVIDAFAASDVLRRDGEVVIVGDGPQRRSLELHARALGVAERVHFTGKVPQSEVGEQFRRASVFAFPSLREFGGAVVIEAMACGLPAVVVDYGGPGEHVTDETGVRLPLGRRRELAVSLRHALESLHADRSRLDRMSQAGLARIRDVYLWDRKAEQVVSVYRQALARHAANSSR